MADHLKDAVLVELVQVMVATGEDTSARFAAALEKLPGCPQSLLWQANYEADEVLEQRFIAPLAERFADQVAARELKSASDELGYGGSRRPAMSGVAGRTSSSHLDADIPF